MFGEALTFERLLAGGGRSAPPARPAHRPDRGRDRDDVPPDRDEPLRACGAHRAARAGRARPRADRRAVARGADGAVRRLGRRSTATSPGGATSRTSPAPPATSTPTRTATSSRSRSTASTCRRATRWSSRTSSCCAPAARARRRSSPQIVGLDLTDPAIWASGIDALAEELDEAERLAAEIGLG